MSVAPSTPASEPSLSSKVPATLHLLAHGSIEVRVFTIPDTIGFPGQVHVSRFTKNSFRPSVVASAMLRTNPFGHEIPLEHDKLINSGLRGVAVKGSGSNVPNPGSA
jgi:hypothetical protein